MKRFLVLAVASSLAVGAHAATIVNGSFELGTDPGSFSTVGVGGTNITGWSVTSGSVDYIGTYWNAADGHRSIDLAGNGPGKIGQQVALSANTTYKLSFYLSGNPDNGGSPSPKLADVFVDGGLMNTYASANIPTWGLNTLTFTNVSAGNKWIEFAANGAGPFGAALDNVSIQAVPEPFTMSLGIAAAGLFIRRRAKANIS